MEPNNSVNTGGKNQYFNNVCVAPQRLADQNWGLPPPMFPLRHHTPQGWLPHRPELRYGYAFPRPPGVFTTPPPPLPSIESNSESFQVAALHSADKMWLQSWLESRHVNSQKVKPVDEKTLTIGEAQQKLRISIIELKKLSHEHSLLHKNVSSYSEEDWRKKWSEIERKITNVHCMLSSFSKLNVLSSLKTDVLKRERKRKRLRKQISQHKNEVYQKQLHRRQLHQQADAWLADMQLSVERTRRDENLKHQADVVLSEVTHRQSDGRRQVALLEALQKLRRARMQAVEAQGGNVSSEQKLQSDHSNTIIDRLLSLWSRQMDEYSKEEHGLRVMLEKSAAKQSDIEIKNIHRILRQWEACLFGAGSNLVLGEPENIASLVAIRQAWDQYIVPNDALVPMASTIPVGWVLPTTPNSLEWQELLK